MATFGKPIENQQILIKAVASVPLSGGPGCVADSLVDTGAQCTMITRRIAETLQPEKVDVATFVGVNGLETESDVFVLRIDLPIAQDAVQEDGSVQPAIHSVGMELEVMTIPYDPWNFGIILGMDCLANFHITMWGGMFVISN